jgi:hypothetical protein
MSDLRCNIEHDDEEIHQHQDHRSEKCRNTRSISIVRVTFTLYLTLDTIELSCPLTIDHFKIQPPSAKQARLEVLLVSVAIVIGILEAATAL